MEVFTHNFHVSALACNVFLEIARNLLAVGVVLVQQIHVFDLRLVFHEGGQRLHLHGGVSIQAEVPIVALLIGQGRVNRRVIKVHHFLAGVALVVLGHGVRDRQGGTRSIALGHVPEPLVNGGFQ